MIKSQLQFKYPHQYKAIKNFSDDLFIADYTEQTKTLAIQRSVEFFSHNPPTDIDFFSLINQAHLKLNAVAYDNSSFVFANGKPKTQCEAVVFPETSEVNSWVLFCELKYSYKPSNNKNNLTKAIKQLYKTRYYYLQNEVISSSNTCYLIASIPPQREPFADFTITPTVLQNLKRKRNIVLRWQNSIKAIDDRFLRV